MVLGVGYLGEGGGLVLGKRSKAEGCNQGQRVLIEHQRVDSGHSAVFFNGPFPFESLRRSGELSAHQAN